MNNNNGKQQVPAYIRRRKVEKALDDIVKDVEELKVVLQQVLTLLEGRIVQARAKL